MAKNYKVNFNKGVIGRGEVLTIEQKNKIKRLASYHNNIDFGMIGL